MRHANKDGVLKLMREGWELHCDESRWGRCWGWLTNPGEPGTWVDVRANSAEALIKRNLIRVSSSRWPISHWELVEEAMETGE
jgi:hypothetical protein